ncbi:MAG: phosphoribosylanthranilate isomerase, partial [Arenicellales bacterium]
DVQAIETLLANVPINMLQFHGDESPEFCAQFNLPYLKAVRMQVSTDLTAFREQYAGARGILLDTFDKNLVGGTGSTFDWSLIRNAEQNQHLPELILAGGLSPDNVQSAIEQTGIEHLDVNSGIESAPGIKDPEKMREVMKVKKML